MIHEDLEGRGGITHAKGHDQELIVTLMSLKCCLRDARILHRYLVVAKMQIKFIELIEDIINERNGKLVFDGEFIEGMKSGTHTPSTFFF